MEGGLVDADALAAEKADLTRKLAVREQAGAGYKQNCAAIRERLAQIEKELNQA